MKNKFSLFILFLFFIFCFLILFKALNISNIYIPSSEKKHDLPNFESKELFSEIKKSSDHIFKDNQFYILNIWASWCVPCRDEHPELMKLSKNPAIKIIGLNYKDNLKNAKKFIEIMGNPYFVILTDKKGIISIELGAFGVPETFIINNKKIIKKYIGPLNAKKIYEIESIIE